MIIWLYTIAYNEAPFVQSFLKAYSAVDKIIVYDNFSTDDTVKLLKKDKRVEIRPHDSGGQIRDDFYLQVKNNCWKEARGKADWVIIVDFDEIFTRAEIVHTKNRCIPIDFKYDLNLQGPFNKDYDLIIPKGYNIFMEDMLLFDSFNPLKYPLRGLYDTYFEKPCCFRPDRIYEMNYNPGCHTAEPIGFYGLVNVLSIPSYKLLHFRFCNMVLYFQKLYQYRQRMSDYNTKSGLGGHYLWDDAKHTEIYMNGLITAKPLIEIPIP